MRYLLWGISAVAMSGWAGTASAQDEPGWELHGFGDVSLKNDYVTPRGLVVTTDGATIQVLNGLVLVAPSGLAIHGGTWVDLNPGYGDVNTDTVNEFDFFVGISGKVTDRLTVGVEYSQFISGQNAFRDERNIELSLKYADGEKDAKFTVNPYAKFFWAVDGDSTVVLGKRGDTFDIELGAVPTVKTAQGTLTFPTWITVGPKTYWGQKGDAIADDNFGVFSTGIKGSVPLKFIKGGAGASIYAQAQYYYLINDNLRAAKAILNGGDDNRSHVVGAVGVSYGF